MKYVYHGKLINKLPSIRVYTNKYLNNAETVEFVKKNFSYSELRNEVQKMYISCEH